ncbi:lysophospholipid acyltransferase family protein [Desulfospira joergensenii]|uniref:lysophospholipid acyltransferase family protein n=1 Tax=Desulfospira joergensenii TaxID=53329 RepID=UPI0003B35E0E|nr:lysophospholipid acyltransferase family protein [Desulfospira joergensenii]
MIDEFIYRMLRLSIWLVGRMPVFLADFCSRALGLIWFRLDRRHRVIVLENIGQAYGERWGKDKVEIMAKEVFKNIASIFFEVAWAYKFDKQEFLSHFTIKGLEHVRKAHAKGRGVIVVTGHMGNFEMMIPAIDETGFKGYGLYRPLDFQPLEWLILDIRQRFGVTMMPIHGASRKLDRILGQGCVVGTLLDQNVDWYKGVFVDFFGRPACTNKGLATLAMRTGAPVVPMYTVRKNRRYLIEFLPEVPVENTGDRIRDIENTTQNFTTAIEFMVRKHPDQYFWVHDRWKTKSYCELPKG